MLIFPAIDIRNGKVVRLRQGDYDQMTVYQADPLEAALQFKEAGAHYLHVVDLDAAKDGTQQNFPVIEGLARESGLTIEVGGGARDEKSVRRYLDAGVQRVIIGTAAIENPALLEKLACLYPGQIAAGIDAKDGKIAIHGWKVITDLDAEELIRSLPGRGIDTVIYTDIARDGLLKGPNLPAYEKLAKVKGLNVVASGGVSTKENVAALSKMNLYAAIIGKALYDGKLSLKRALEIVRKGKRP